MKIHSVGPELIHADRRTNKTKPTVFFRNFFVSIHAPVCPSVRMETHKYFYFTNLDNMA